MLMSLYIINQTGRQKRPFVRARLKWEDDITMCLKSFCEGVDWIDQPGDSCGDLCRHGNESSG
jgi:hypothetical protein